MSSGPGHAPELHRCPECASNLVYPYDWDEAGEHRYTLFLRCPNCEWTAVSRQDWETVRRLECALDEGERGLVADLQALIRANVEEDFERFLAALRADQVWPMDF